MQSTCLNSAPKRRLHPTLHRSFNRFFNFRPARLQKRPPIVAVQQQRPQFGDQRKARIRPRALVVESLLGNRVHPGQKFRLRYSRA